VESIMTKARDLWQSTRTFGAGVLLGLPAVTPVFAATGDDPITPRGMLLIGSLALLGVGLALKALSMRNDRGNTPPADAPDLRWWKNA
jgi:hypothetical protein